MKFQKNHYPSIEQIQSTYKVNKGQKPLSKEKEQSFDDILKVQTALQEDLKFSKHATERLSSRNIQLSKQQMVRLEEGVSKANTKGIQESLVLMDNLAFVVNVPNKTVITAMAQGKTDEQIFTNIDGAVII